MTYKPTPTTKDEMTYTNRDMETPLSEDQINRIARNFYWIMYGHGPIIPRIAIKIRLGLLFGDKYFEKDYIDELKAKYLPEDER